MKTLDDLVKIFELNRDDIQVGVGETNGWGWADVALAQCVPSGNPYEYVAYNSICDDWPAACAAVEQGLPDSENYVRDLMAMFRDMVSRAD